MINKLLLIFLLITKLSFGQSHFIDSTSHGHENSQFHNGWAPDSAHFQDYVYYFSGDSIIQNYHYLQMYRVGTDSVLSFSNHGFNLVPISERIGLLREDTVTSKVYFIPNTSTFESLLYDFSLIAGDTIPTSYGFTNCSPGNIYLMDSIYFGNQIRHRLFVNATNSRTGGVRIFQGIGANCGLLGTMCIYFDGIYPCLMSYYNSTDTIQFINCSDIVSVSEVNHSANEIFVSTNPFVEKIEYSISNKNYREASYTVFSLLGNRILENRLDNPDGSINLSALTPGIYFLCVVVDGEQIVKKIIKE